MCSTAYGARSWAATILDEIALEGLDGVTLTTLWLLISERLELTLPLPKKFQEQIWNYILRQPDKLEFFVLPEERPGRKLYNRFDELDEQFGVPIACEENPYQIYKFMPQQVGELFGSCEHFKTRVKINISELIELSDGVESALEKYGNKLVIVASQQLRYESLTPPNVSIPKELTAIQYAVWEAVGRARFNGEATTGPWSLQQRCKDQSILFYIKNKLARLNVLSQLPFTEKRNGRLMRCTLLTLPRFFRHRKSFLQNAIEKLYYAIKELPEHRISTSEASELMSNPRKLKTLKKIMTTTQFQQIFETKSYPYAEIYNKPKSSNGQRAVVIITLRNPDLKIEDLLQFDEYTADDCKLEIELLSNKHAFIDMPIEEEAYRAIIRHGKRGISLSELGQYMGLHHLTGRTLLKYLDQKKLLTTYNETVGRQRIVRYVAVHQENGDTEPAEEQNVTVLEKIRCADEPNIPDYTDAPLADVPEITVDIKPMKHIYKGTDQSRVSQRQRNRPAIIVRIIDQYCCVQMSFIRNSIHAEEKAQGFTEEICRKSLFRILQTLCSEQIVNCYEITTKYKDSIRLYRYVTHPKIHAEHKVLQYEILRLKNTQYVISQEHNDKETKVKRKRLTKDRAAFKRAELEKQVETDNTPKPPKMFLAREMHQFLYYILMELHVDQEPIEMTEDLVHQWQRTEPELRTINYFEQWKAEKEPLSKCVANLYERQETIECCTKAQPYCDEISWRTFIPPLQKYSDKPAGWVLLKDAIDRIPLSMFNKIFHIDRHISSNIVQECLRHPVRQHYLMRQLPATVQALLVRPRLKRLYLSGLRLLNHMGLIQVSDWQAKRDPLMFWVYLNRQTRILDTTPSEQGYTQVSTTQEYTSLKYEFFSRNDVVQYWTHLQRICTYTKLGFRSKKLARINERPKQLEFIRSVEFQMAATLDTGEVSGDGLGPAGLGSHLYAYRLSSWSWTVPIKNKNLCSSNNSKKFRHSLPKQRRGIRNQPTLTRLKVHVSREKSKTTKKCGPRDDIDRDALKNMRKLRVTFTKEEDRLLVMARCVYLYLSVPINVLSLLHVGRICRDIIRSHLGICNKTTQACLRRLQFLIKMKRDIPDVYNWLYMLQSNNELWRTYDTQFLDNLREIYPRKDALTDAVQVHCILLLTVLYRTVTKSLALPSCSFILPDLYADFLKKMRESASVSCDDEEVLYHINPQTERDLSITMAQCVLHSTLCCVRDKTLYHLQAFEIYKYYTEDVLNAAFTKARQEALVITMKRQNMSSSSRQLTGPAFFLSWKYKHKLHYLKVAYGLYDNFYATFNNDMCTLFGNSNNRCVELKSPTYGQLFFMAEYLACNYLTIDLHLPTNILTVDTTQRQNVSATDRIIEHYSSILENAPPTEYEKNFEHDVSGKQVRVKFHPANLRYKIVYIAYDRISKLPDYYLHFFCALDHLQQMVDINFSKLQRKDDDNGGTIVHKCPFNCILKSENYLNAIERIVHEKKALIKELSAEMAPQKLLNQASSGNAIMVQPSNLLTLVRMLETFWQKKEDAYDRKDFGNTNLKPNRTIDWQALCSDIIDYNPNDYDAEYDGKDYEPTLNKEERARAQDVFVISLPTIKLGLSEMLQNDKELTKWSQNDKVKLPKVLLETELQQQEILQKILNEAYWQYKDNNFETLRPILNELQYNDSELLHMADILEYIENHKLGVDSKELKQKFPLGNFLKIALQRFIDHSLIKRVGVSTYLYVHRKHIRDWVVHTFHIKRLEQERLGSSNNIEIDLQAKRKYAQVEQENEDMLPQQQEQLQDEANSSDNGESSSKRVKLDTAVDHEPSTSNEEPLNKKRRQTKPVNRYDGTNQTTTTTTTSGTNTKNIISEAARDVIVMRPQPWMRVNGSLNRRVLDRWMSSILSQCIAQTGCIVYTLFLKFPQMLPVDIMFLLELLCDMKCIHLVEIQQPQPVTLEIEDYESELNEEIVTDFYDPNLTYVVTHADAIGRLANFIGQKKYNMEFV